MATEKKTQTVSHLAQLLARNPVVVATSYQGLPVSQMTELRQRLRQVGAEYHVVKNTLARRAGEEVGRPQVASLLSGPTALAFTAGEPTGLVKVFLDYARSARAPLNLRGALLDGKALDAAQVVTLGTLPPREVLLGQLLGQLQWPVSGLMRVLSAPLTGLALMLKARQQQLEGNEEQKHEEGQA